MARRWTFHAPAAFRVLVVALPLLAAVLVASGTAAGAARLCYDSAAGCRTNLEADEGVLAAMGAFAVCSNAFILNAPDSVTCAADDEGIRFACTPAAGGYCNATARVWGENLYNLTVSVTVGTAQLTFQRHLPGNYTVKLNGATQTTIQSGDTATITLPLGASNVVEFVRGTTSTPGTSDAPPAAASAAASGTTGDLPVIVNVGDGAPTNGAGASSGRGVMWAGVILGLVVVAVGEPHLVGLAKKKPRHWLTALGLLLVIASFLPLFF